MAKTRRRMLVIADACVDTGFARWTHNAVPRFAEAFDVSVLGINYLGDPHPEFPYDCYTCWPGGDVFGVGRVKELCEKLAPSVVVLQQDPWNVQQYLAGAGNVPMVGCIAVDGLNCNGNDLSGLRSVVFWTKFAQAQAKAGGYTGPSTVVPLGVDLGTYYPQERAAVRERMNLAAAFEDRGLPADSFVVLAVGRNQTRKRLDLTIEYFAEWVKSRNVGDAVLWMHVAPTGDAAYDLDRLAQYHGIADRVFITDVGARKGLSEEAMARVYAASDLYFSTTVGEGMGLPALEAMACRRATLLPDWSAYGDWARDGALLVPCTSTMANQRFGTIGGIMDRSMAVQSLHRLYSSRRDLDQLAADRLAVAERPQYRWETVTGGFLESVERAIWTGDRPALALDATQAVGVEA